LKKSDDGLSEDEEAHILSHSSINNIREVISREEYKQQRGTPSDLE